LLLTVDIGNSHTVLGYFEGNSGEDFEISKLIETRRFVTQSIGAEIRSEFSTTDKIESVVISSVVPSVTQAIFGAFTGTLNRRDTPVQVIDHQWPFSFQIRTDSPDKTGIDRLVNAEAAIRDYGSPCIIVDAGTATTVCAVSGKPEFLGGAIIPGLKISMEALSQNTAQLFDIELTPPSRAIGRNTTEALQSGLVLGYASMIDGMVRRFKSELGVFELPVIATGGLSTLFKGTSKELTHFDSDLTLRGIAYLFEKKLKLARR